MELIVFLMTIPLWAIVYFLSEICNRLKEQNDRKDGE